MFQAIPTDLLSVNSKSDDPRLWGQVKSQMPSASTAFCLGGYPDDEGIQLNGGRTGAKDAPDQIRRIFYRMTPPLFSSGERTQICDFGNLQNSGSLLDRHQSVRNQVLKVLNQNLPWVGLGGGHDYGFPDGAGFCDSLKSSSHKPLVINFDAHFDVRPMDKGPHSGTPFYRLLSEFPDLELYQIGMQSQCNAKAHYDWCRERSVKVLSFDELEASAESFVSVILRFLEPILVRPRPVFISLDIDAFSSAYAMGCSQSWSSGFTPRDLFPVLQTLFRRMDVKVLGIYEVSPPLDQDNRTSKLAAQVLHHFYASRISS